MILWLPYVNKLEAIELGLTSYPVLLGRLVSCEFNARRDGHIPVPRCVLFIAHLQGCSSPSSIGTGFTITGGRRPGYGPFSLSLDGQQLFNGNPAPTSSPIKNTLVTMSGLPNDLHTVVLTNSGGAPVDIDAITFQVRIGSVGCVHTLTAA